ncbi:MAG: 3'-5' exoribonuclease YhaM family protein [Syntrophobacteraceae bacterium]
MAKAYISDIQPNQLIDTFFLLAEKQLRATRNGASFLTLKLVDKTGEITGRVWERAEEVAASLPSKGHVRVSGRTEKYRDELQIQIQSISPADLGAIDPADFLPVCPIETEVLLQRLKRLAGSVKRRPLQLLLRSILGDRSLMDRFARAPAAKSVHHAYLGGLLEHSVSVAGVVTRIAKHYEELDAEILVVGALLHDVGKVDEYVYDLYFDYSDAGRLLGHMVLGLRIVEEKIRGIKEFPVEEAIVLEHLILSHHGELEKGSVKVPMTREAYILHFADDMDAKMNTLSRVLQDTKGGDETWTSYQPLFDRFFYRGPAAGTDQDDKDGAVPLESEAGVQLSLWQRGGKDPGR